jgi:hypothetical protein
MHEVRDAVTAGDWDKAAAASKELVDAVQRGDAKLASMPAGGASQGTTPTPMPVTSGGGTSEGSLPPTGSPDSVVPLTLLLLALGLTGLGLAVGKRVTR